MLVSFRQFSKHGRGYPDWLNFVEETLRSKKRSRAFRLGAASLFRQSE